MKREKLLDSKGNPIQGLYYIDLKNGRNIYARFHLPNAPQYVNLTKEHGVTTISEAKKQRNKLLEMYNNPNADFLKGKVLVNDLIEDYIAKRPINTKYPNRSQRNIVDNRYKLYLQPHLKYVTVGKLANKHLLKIKTMLDNRGVGKNTYQKIRTLLISSLKGTGINFEKLFNGFEAIEANTIKNVKKLKIDDYFKGYNLEEVAHGFYNEYTLLLDGAKTSKDKDKYALLLYLLITASRVGETALLRVKDVELFDKKSGLYRIVVPKEVNKSHQTREVLLPKIITPYIRERISKAKSSDYLFTTSIENVIPYHFKKSLKQFTLNKTNGLSVHIFRSLFRNIAMDRELSPRAINYIMDRQHNLTVDEKYYDARLTTQQRYNVFKLTSTYEKICRGELPKQEIDFSTL